MAKVKALVVAWGWAGSDQWNSGWGWAGWLLYTASHSVATQSYTVTVWAWWVKQDLPVVWNNWANSVFSTMTAIWGWGWGGWSTTIVWANWGSGWGGWNNTSPWLWTSWQWNNWWPWQWTPTAPAYWAWWGWWAWAVWWSWTNLIWWNWWNWLAYSISWSSVYYAGWGWAWTNTTPLSSGWLGW